MEEKKKDVSEGLPGTSIVAEPIIVGGIVMSNPCDKVAAALVRAQAKMATAVERDGSATVEMKKGGSYSYKYASFDKLIEGTRPHLNDEGLSLIQVPTVRGAEVEITTMLLHESGQYITNTNVLHAKSNAIHDIGSAITYGRRYAYAPMVGVAAEEDDDGKLAQFGTAGGGNGREHASDERQAHAQEKKDSARIAVMRRFHVRWSDLFKAAITNGVLLPDGIEAETPDVERAMKAALFGSMSDGTIHSATQTADVRLAQMAQILDERQDAWVTWYESDAWHKDIPATMLKTAETVVDDETVLDDDCGAEGFDEAATPFTASRVIDPEGDDGMAEPESAGDDTVLVRMCADCGGVLSEKDIARIEAMGLKRDLCKMCTTASTVGKGKG